MEHPQNESLQRALKREFLQAHARGPILTRELDFERKVGFAFTQKYPQSLAYLRTMHREPTRSEQRRAALAAIAEMERRQSEIESEAPT